MNAAAAVEVVAGGGADVRDGAGPWTTGAAMCGAVLCGEAADSADAVAECWN